MPRKPRRSGQLLPRPFAFSPFARSVARVANACSSKRNVSNSKSDGMPSSKLLGVSLVYTLLYTAIRKRMIFYVPVFFCSRARLTVL